MQRGAAGYTTRPPLSLGVESRRWNLVRDIEMAGLDASVTAWRRRSTQRRVRLAG
jgi:hypothetical protein